MEVGSSGGPDKNRVYGLSNTTAENLRSARSVSTVGSSPSVSNTLSEEFIALKQQNQQLSTNYDELHRIVMEMRSKMGDDTCAASLWPGSTTSLFLILLLQLRRYSSLILFFKHIKFVMNMMVEGVSLEECLTTI